jgi:hypothetical protein
MKIDKTDLPFFVYVVIVVSCLIGAMLCYSIMTIITIVITIIGICKGW